MKRDISGTRFYCVHLPDWADFETWRVEARRFSQADIRPEDVAWQTETGQEGLFAVDQAEHLQSVRSLVLNRRCMALLESILRHASPQRFDLAYRILWRSQNHHALDLVHTDPDIAGARRMDHQVRRDAHKMKAFLRFQECSDDRSERRHFTAWFEPEHYILPSVASFFVSRFQDMDWLIATPKGSLMWDGSSCAFNPQPCAKPELSDDLETLWQTYYRSIFNPARIKTAAMRSEMPRKYWKNLPETRLIPHMLAEAGARVEKMVAEQSPDKAPAFHHRLQARRQQERDLPPPDTLASLRQGLTQCQRCSLYCHATQAVAGEGNAEARILVVGEQPGDQEDLQGRPFVGPAGKVFDAALGEVGIDRKTLYVTNAVKHFKFVNRGTRRIHQTPDVSEVRACMDWLRQEIALVGPDLIVTMGATALHAFDSTAKLTPVRGQFMERSGVTHFATVHPSYLLRIPAGEKKQAEHMRFRQDWLRIREWIEAR